MKEKNSIFIKRICGCCKEGIYINNYNINDAIYYDKKTYHSNCFIGMSEKRSKMKRTDVSEKWKWVLSNINVIKKETFIHLRNAIEKEEIFEFIKDAYNITIVPTTVWQKLGNIYAGTFKGMSTGIPVSHLFDMWKRKIDMLNNIADKNRSKGSIMSAEQRLNYDLSILVNKYDSYLKWLEQQKIIEAELKKSVVSEKSNVTCIINTKEKTKSCKDDDMTDLVDDIFD